MTKCLRAWEVELTTDGTCGGLHTRRTTWRRTPSCAPLAKCERAVVRARLGLDLCSSQETRVLVPNVYKCSTKPHCKRACMQCGLTGWSHATCDTAEDPAATSPYTRRERPPRRMQIAPRHICTLMWHVGRTQCADRATRSCHTGRGVPSVIAIIHAVYNVQSQVIATPRARRRSRQRCPWFRALPQTPTARVRPRQARVQCNACQTRA